LDTAGSKTFSAEIRIPPEQLSPEHPPQKSSRTLQEEPHFVALSAGATSPLLLRSLNTTLEQIAQREILLLRKSRAKVHRTDAILKKFDQKINLKKNVQRNCKNFWSIQLHHLQPSLISWDYPFKVGVVVH
jgi:hypothetical protein